MKKSAFILLGVIVAACASAPEPPEDQPVLRETTLARFDGTAISMEELQSLRPSAVATAETIARIDRMLKEPWAEQRGAHIFVENLRSQHPSDTRLAQTLWETTEPAARGNGRDLFREYGFFANQFTASGFGPRIRPGSLEAYVRDVLEDHSDADSRGMLNAAWRKFAPLVIERNNGYLASSWELELDHISPVHVGLSDSLLGPFERTVVQGDTLPSFFGPTDSYEGYTASMILLDLLAPGPESPVAMAIRELHQLAVGQREGVNFAVEHGPVERLDEVDLDFFSAALAGLQVGDANIESLPQSAIKVNVVFSYLVDQAEARASLSFSRISGDWKLTLFEYEPAAASLVGGNARLDLMPTIRALLSRGRQG